MWLAESSDCVPDHKIIVNVSHIKRWTTKINSHQNYKRCWIGYAHDDGGGGGDSHNNKDNI